jgi:hypothetical protein
MSPVGLGTKNHCAGEGQQQFSSQSSTPILYSLYINDALAAPGTQLALFEEDTCIYATEKHERRVLCKLQRGLAVVNSWCERLTIKINEGKTQATYFSRRLRVPEDVLQLNGRGIFPFVNNVT